MPADGIEETLSFGLVQFAKSYRAYTNRLLQGIGLHAGQEHFLLSLWREEGQSLSQLAEALHVQPATLSNMVTRMEAVGLVRRRQSDDDQRVFHVHLTHQGRELRDALQTVWDELEHTTTRGLTQPERAELRRLLDKVNRNIG